MGAIWVGAVSCGYVGDPLPPALHIAKPVTDLRGRQVGSALRLEFTVPALTVDELPVKDVAAVDLRVGPNTAGGWNEAVWEAAAKPVPARAVTAGSIAAEAEVAEFAGREVVAAVRLGNQKGRVSRWSNLVIVRVETPLVKPENLKAVPAPEGILVSWTGLDGAAAVYREGELIGEGSGGSYLDRKVDLGRAYQYEVEGRRGQAVSERAGPVAVTMVDTFAPAAPVKFAALAGPRSVELSWDRNMEPDLKGYRVRRASGDGEFVVLADFVETPAYSDRAVESGVRYRYAVTALDLRNNESKQSEIVEITLP
jgi:hypothetical protein